MIDKYDLKLKKSKDVNERIYSVYENDRLILKSVHLEDINKLKINKELKLKVVVEPEITGIKLMLLLFLQFLSSGFDKYFFMSFFCDSIEIQNYPFDKLNLTYMYSFDTSFSIDGNFVAKQQKILSSKTLYILLLLFIPLILILMYCTIIVLLGTGYFIVRILIAVFLCVLQIYLISQIYRLNKFRH